MKDLEQQLVKLKQQIDTLTSSRDKLRGQLDLTMDQLHTQYGITNLDDAMAEVGRLRQEADRLEEEVRDHISTITTKYTGLLKLANLAGQGGGDNG